MRQVIAYIDEFCECEDCGPNGRFGIGIKDLKPNCPRCHGATDVICFDCESCGTRYYGVDKAAAIAELKADLSKGNVKLVALTDLTVKPAQRLE